MRIGLDLDGTVYAHPAFFAELIRAMAARGHTFHCISTHGRGEWDADDVPRLAALGVPAELIDPSLLRPERHTHLYLKGAAADRCDVVFDDDVRLAAFTRSPVFAPLAR